MSDKPDPHPRDELYMFIVIIAVLSIFVSNGLSVKADSSPVSQQITSAPENISR